MTLLAEISSLWTLLGRLHPLLLHFPLALAVCAAAITLVRRVLRRDSEPSPVVGFCLWAALAVGLAAAWSGWTLAEHHGFTGSLVTLHRWTSIGGLAVIAMACVLRVLMHQRRGRFVLAADISTILAGAVMSVTGYFGGEMVWGSGWLLDPLSDVLTGGMTEATHEQDHGQDDAGSVEPWAAVAAVFEARCAECHGPDRQKSGLRLFPLPWSYEGESSPPPIVAGDTSASFLLELITAPPDDDFLMPPKGDRLSAEEVETIRMWIEAGCPVPLVPTLEPPRLSAAQRAQEVITDCGGFVQPVSVEGSGLEVNLAHAVPPADDALLAQLEPLGGDVTRLDLSGSAITCDGMSSGGVKGGQVIGRTDDFGYNILENPVHVHDLNATILQLMGIDHERLTYRYQGRDHRLTDVHGRVVHDLIA